MTVSRSSPRFAFAILAATLLAACGGAQHARRPRPRPRSAIVAPVVAATPVTTAIEPTLDPGQLLVFFKRTVGGDPMASQLTVDHNGRAAALVTLGGIDGEKKQVFQTPARQLKNLEHVISHTRLRDTPCCNDFRSYVYWVSIGGHTWQLQQGEIPQPMRRLIGTLDSITNTHTIFSSP